MTFNQYKNNKESHDSNKKDLRQPGDTNNSSSSISNNNSSSSNISDNDGLDSKPTLVSKESQFILPNSFSQRNTNNNLIIDKSKLKVEYDILDDEEDRDGCVGRLPSENKNTISTTSTTSTASNNNNSSLNNNNNSNNSNSYNTIINTKNKKTKNGYVQENIIINFKSNNTGKGYSQNVGKDTKPSSPTTTSPKMAPKHINNNNSNSNSKSSNVGKDNKKSTPTTTTTTTTTTTKMDKSNNNDPTNWTIDMVTQWLEGIDIHAEVINLFRVNEVDGKTLLSLNESNYKELGITTLARKKTFDQHFSQLKQNKNVNNNINIINNINNNNNNNYNYNNNQNNQSKKKDLSKEYQPFGKSRDIENFLNKKLEEYDRTDITAQLQSAMAQKQLDDILSRQNLDDGVIQGVIRLFSHKKMMESLLTEDSNRLYLLLMKSQFIGHHSNLTRFIMSNDPPTFRTNLGIQKHCLNMLMQIAYRFTDGIKMIPLDTFIDIINVSIHAKNEYICTNIQKLEQHQLNLKERSMMEKYNKSSSSTPDKNDNSDEEEEEDWEKQGTRLENTRYQRLPIIPQSHEIKSQLSKDLKPLKLGLYESTEEYINTQFCLLREDMIDPMRQAIRSFDRGEANKNFYRNVQFKSLAASYSSVCFNIEFQVKRILKWEKYPRLLKGSLVGISNDGFENIIWGVVEQRPSSGSVPQIQISIQSEFTGGIQFLFTNRFDMIESPSYFESYKNVLHVLQKIDDKTLPFKEYLLKCQTDTRLPAYLSRNPLIDFSTTFKDVEPRHQHYLHSTFPTKLDQLDDSQLQAIKHCLTSEVSLVQGPPGTGKSFIGRKLFELIYRHTQTLDHEKKAPILLVCYTNHALDQFLMNILHITKNVIRIGSRSREKELDEFNLRGKIKRDQYQIQRFKQREMLVYEIELVLNEIIKPLNENDIKTYATYDHYETLIYKGNESYKEWMKSIEKVVKEVPSKVIENAKNQSVGVRKIAESSDTNDGDEDTNDVDEQDEETVKQLMNERAMDDSSNDSHKNIQDIDIRYPMWVLAQESGSFESQDHVHSLNPQDRIKLYRHWQQSRIRVHLDQLEELKQAYEKLAREIVQHEDAACARALVNCDVIAATTTGASRMKRVLESLNSKVVIIEEAAEVLESHVIAILPKSIEHLIMIGDHEQLKPSNSVYQLAQKYQFDLSLFERIVKNKMNFKTLNTQRRMVPNISRFILPIYPDLQNHVSVLQRNNKISGLPSNVFFFDHSNPESVSEQSSSKYNLFEADYVIELANYIVKQEQYKASDIAILTPYTGQLIQILDRKKKMHNSKLDQLTIRTVDQFQGEEKNIIILSLVRSNTTKSAGFLAIRNRINVSLSRARDGLFIIGNSALLERADPIWENLIEILKGEKLLNNHITLHCENHHDQTTTIKSAKDFAMVPEGGCLQQCDYRLDCSHQCPKCCHFDDPKHNYARCLKVCDKVNDVCGHNCQRNCHGQTDCGNCLQKVNRVLPSCKHTMEAVECHLPINSIVCTHKCEKLRPDCKHPCRDICGRSCLEKKCKVEVTKTLPCGHEDKKPCYNKSTSCKKKCKVNLPCGHLCNATCDSHKDGKHPVCNKNCERTLICGHRCIPHPCNEPCKPCSKRCENRCPHSKCNKSCSLNCVPCGEPCNRVKCAHQSGCTKLCSEKCSVQPCNVRCNKTLKCGHQCIGICGEKCPTLCRVCNGDYKETITMMTLSEFEDTDTFIQLPCNDLFERESFDNFINIEGENGAISLKACPNCKRAIYPSLLRYKDQLTEIWNVIEGIKKRLLNTITQEEINQVITSSGFTAGHWFKCPNGHVYYIGECGGAMEKGKCIECKEEVGGGSHRLLDSNSHSNIDGSQGPQYPYGMEPRGFH